MREIGTVDEDNEIGTRPQREIGGLPHAPENRGDARHHFAQTHDRSRIEREKAFQALGRHGRAADAHNAKASSGKFLQSRHQLRAQLIAGRLARHQHDGGWAETRARLIHAGNPAAQSRRGRSRGG